MKSKNYKTDYIPLDRSQTRSAHYQGALLETPTEPFKLTEAVDRECLGQLDPWSYNEEIVDLKDQLRESFWRLVASHLTKRQQEVVKLRCLGLTQTMIAKKLKVNQSSITKSINGNCDYKNGKRVYGGIIRKIQKLIITDPEVQKIFGKIKELEEK
jgi:DNA-binding CsgD family transcriptional regulator